MKRYLIFLSALLGLSVGCHAASPSFSSFYTNHFTTNNLIIKANLNPLQFDTNASTVTITITNVSGTPGSSLWTNKGGLGVIQPLSGQVTNALLFVSGSSAAATNTLLTLDTANTWTDQNTKLIDLRHSGTNVGYITPYGSFESGKGVAWASPSSDDLFLGVHDTSLGESDYALIYSAAIDGSSPTNYSEFSATLNTGASPAGVLNLASLTNGVSSYFQVTVQPDQSVARIELQSQGQRMFYVEDQTGYAGGGTKMLGDDGKYHDGLVLWTNIANVLQPLVGFDVLVTNLSSTHSLIANGSFHISGLSTSNLVANTNNLNPYQVGTFQLTGPTATASDTRIQLGTGIGYQLLTIENLSTNSAFNMRNGEPQWDDASSYVRLRGDWSTTNQGDTLLLYHNGFFWSEINRSFANTNVVAPSVINPTDNYIPVRQSAGVFADSPLNIPSAGSTNVIADGALYVGPNSFGFWGASDYSIVSVHDVDQSEPNNNGFAIWTISGALNGAIDGTVTTNAALLSVGVANGTFGSSVVWTGVQTNMFLDGQFGTNNPSVFRLHPTVEDISANAAYTFDTPTWQEKTAADLARFRNASTNLVTIGPNGGIGFGPHANGAATNVLYRSGSSLVVTNGATTNAFTLRNGLGTGFHMTFTSGGAPRLLTDNGFIWIGGTTVLEANLIPDSANTRSVGTMAAGGSFADSVFQGTHYIVGSNDSGANYTRLAINHTGNAGDIQYKSDALGTQTFRPHVFQIGSTNVAKIDTTSAAGETRFWLYDEDNGTMERVSVGIPDSGGAGFKLLRIPCYY